MIAIAYEIKTEPLIESDMVGTQIQVFEPEQSRIICRMFNKHFAATIATTILLYI